ncbi:metal ABC transporter ATP-binding protein [Halobacteriales archaeon SW_8_68_21]|nr:MAG: metal ABC transporter ATP-binding protein [Halobacteriales archaeon SW_8_68_21]
MSEIVDLDDVTFAYGDTVAVSDVSLTVEEGEFLGLVGPNGSGKTTLLHLMLGLHEPDAGSVELFGRPVEEFDDGGRIGYVSQKATSRGGAMPVTVRECVTMGRFAHTGRGRLSTADLVSELSGGQRQRAYIARALASDADLLALDEPTVGVDAESRDAFYALLDELNDEGITVILIEHDIGVVTDRANRIACVNTKLYHHGDTESFVESDALVEAYGTTGQVVHHHH